ncbi:MAG: hypothetical protein HYX57_03600 [Chloroflexi bacterium]|nr:hypothetical protein [Chloroflexota bacterium]
MRLARTLTTFALAAVLSGMLAPGVAANANDPLNAGVWGANFRGTYQWGPNLTVGWMRSQASAAIATIGHTLYRNPDFELTTSSSANGIVDMKDNHSTPCPDADPGHTHIEWLACADPNPDRTWFVWLTNIGVSDSPDRCWWDGSTSANRTCSGFTPSEVDTYDVQSVVLNEMGHVNTLGHHVNPDYGDAVVQLDPVHYNHTFWKNRTLRSADLGALLARYGNDCQTPPCPSGPEP